jgi:hypothetical protein
MTIVKRTATVLIVATFQRNGIRDHQELNDGMRCIEGSGSSAAAAPDPTAARPTGVAHGEMPDV